jgi:hypothetical protein
MLLHNGARPWGCTGALVAGANVSFRLAKCERAFTHKPSLHIQVMAWAHGEQLHMACKACTHDRMPSSNLQHCPLRPASRCVRTYSLETTPATAASARPASLANAAKLSSCTTASCTIETAAAQCKLYRIVPSISQCSTFAVVCAPSCQCSVVTQHKADLSFAERCA